MSEKCLNIGMTVCFWCGKSTGIAIGDRLVDCRDKWNVNRVFGGYEPCDKCKENMSKGFTVMIAQDKPSFKNQPEIQENVYPTSQFIVISNEAKARMFNIDNDKCFMEIEVAKNMGLVK
jgi:hypothetical protein